MCDVSPEKFYQKTAKGVTDVTVSYVPPAQVQGEAGHTSDIAKKLNVPTKELDDKKSELENLLKADKPHGDVIKRAVEALNNSMNAARVAIAAIPPKPNA